MVKTNLRGELAFGLLAPALHVRFSELFGVASRKSVFAWQESTLPQAQVVVLDISSDLSLLLNRPPCVVWVGAVRPVASNFSAWTGRLAHSYTVADLIDVLDRAAVFLLDWQARQRKPVAPANALGDNGIQSSVPLHPSTVMTAEGTYYRLSAWVFLSAPFDSARCVSALALLTHQPVTVRQLQQHSGLNAAMAVDLLHELARRNVLEVNSAPLPTATRNAPNVHKGFLRRVSHWLKGTSAS
ncbi:MAG: hypothetical protein EOO27_21115 [Comamonadaceae bacterium]|nr:MAG: hypothetical protein EOO27_21115 [Comamonadaceae bacterium]